MILFRYLSKEVLLSMLAVSSTLLVIVMSRRFVKYIAQAASGDLDPGLVFSIMAYRLPSFLELVLPLGLFIGILLAYGRLYVESEMTVMTACGLSTKRLALYTLIPSFFVAFLVAFISLYASPAGIAKVQEMLQEAKNSTGLETLVLGSFRVDDKTGRVTYIERMTNDNQIMQEVFFVDQTPQTEGGGVELSVVFADQGQIQMNEAGNARYLLLDNGYRYIGRPGGQDFSITQFERFGQLLEEEEQQIVNKKADARSTNELLRSNTLEDQATIQWRISLAILVPILALIAQSLSETNHRRGRYVKMLPAFLLYIFYLVILNAARDAVVKQKLPVEWGMWSVHLIFLTLAVLLLFGADWWRSLQYSKVVQPLSKEVV